MSVESRAEISIGKSSVFEICKIIEKLGYDFNFKEYITVESVKSGYIYFNNQGLNYVFCCESTFEDLCLTSVSDVSHFNLLKEIVSYIGGKVNIDDYDENSWVYIEKTKSLSGNIYDKEFSIYRALKDDFTVEEIKKIIKFKENLKEIL